MSTDESNKRKRDDVDFKGEEGEEGGIAVAKKPRVEPVASEGKKQIALEFESARYFRDVFEKAVLPVVTNDNITLSEDGLKMLAADSANIAVIRLLLKKDTFKSYSMGGLGDTTLGLDIKKFISCLGMARGKAPLNMRYDEGGDDIKLRFTSTETVRDAGFSLSLQDILSQMCEELIPDIKYEAVFKVPANDLFLEFKDLKNISDSTEISVRPDHVLFTVIGEGQNAAIKLPKDTNDRAGGCSSIECLNYDPENPVKDMFATEKLLAFAKAASQLSQEVTVSLSAEGYPMKFGFDLSTTTHKMVDLFDDGHMEKSAVQQVVGHIDFMLCPQAEEVS